MNYKKDLTNDLLSLYLLLYEYEILLNKDLIVFVGLNNNIMIIKI